MDKNEKLYLAAKLAALEYLLSVLYAIHFRNSKDPVKASQDFEQRLIDTESAKPKYISIEENMLLTEHLSRFAQYVTAELLHEQEK